MPRLRTAPLMLDDSASVSASLERRRGGGRMPPVGQMCAKIEDELLPKTRPIDLSPSPLRHRSQISVLSAAVKKRRWAAKTKIVNNSPIKVKKASNPVSLVSPANSPDSSRVSPANR